jgi:hypothetical protein
MNLRTPAWVAASTATGRRLLGRWWRRQSPARQDRFATLAPLVSVLLFLAAIISAFWYLRNEEIEREAEAVKRDVEIAQQQVPRPDRPQEQLIRIARGDAGLARLVEFQRLAAALVNERPEVLQVTWLDARKQRARYPWPTAGPRHRRGNH